MRKFYAFLILMFVASFVYAQTTYTTTGTGNYTDAIWTPSIPPSTIPSGDKVVISSGHNVTINTTVQVYGEYENSGTTTLSSRLMVRSGGTLTQNGSCAGTYSQLYILSGGTVNCIDNGGTIPSAARFFAGSYLIFSGITTTAPTLTAGDQFGYLEFNSSSQSVEIDLPYLDIENDLDITNTGTSSVNFTSNTNETDIAGNLNIGSSGTLILEPGAKVTVNGTLSNSSGTDGLIMQSNSTTTHTGSLIASQDVSGTVQRYLTANRWYMFGPATTGSTSNDVSGSYLQYYTESTNSWTYVTATNYNLLEGVGYAYYGTSNNTVSFSGTLYNTDASFSNMSMSDEGWHILSNPFSSALTWGSPAWSLSNVSGTAKIYNGSDWVDKSSGGILAANQGFAIQVSNATNSLTIPASAKVHNSQSFQKDAESNNDFLSFSLTDNETSAKDIFYLRSYSDATEGFDLAYDSKEFMPEEPTTGKLFAIVDDLKLSTIAVPVLQEDRSYNLGFIAGTAGSYEITLDDFSFGSYELILEDKLEDKLISMNVGDSYSFNSSIEEQDRFILHLKNASGVSDFNNIEGLDIWGANGTVYIQNENLKTLFVEVFNISGQLVYSQENVNDQFFTMEIREPKGVYLVKVSEDKQVVTKSIIK